MEETRALLDALMGPNRNKKEVTSSTGGPEWLDKNVCRNFLCGFCPHDWFSMPKRQLQPCNKIHSEHLREKFEAHPDAKKHRAWFEEDFLNYLQPIARECDSFIVRERVKCRPRASGGKGARMAPDAQNRVDELEARYAELVRRSEDAADSSLTKSKELMGDALVLKEEIDTVRAKHTTEFEGEDICETCGVKYPLGRGGAEWHDKQSHMKGKTHQGFATIRSKIDELLSRRKEWDTWRADRRADYEPLLEREREAERPPREREREPPRERTDASGGVDHRGDRGGAKGARDRDRDRDRERERPRDRSAPRRKDDKKDGDRDRDRDRDRGGKAKGGKKDRSRSASRSRSRGRRQSAKARSRSRSGSGSSSNSGGRRKEKNQDKKEKEKSAKAGRSRSRSSSSSSKERSRRAKRESPPPPPPDPPTKPPPPKRKPPPSSSSSDEQAQPEDEKDGITVLEADLPEFWARIAKKLKGEVRNEAVGALSSATKERLEKWLAARVRGRKPKTTAGGVPAPVPVARLS